MGVSLQDAKQWLGLDADDTLEDHRLSLILQGVRAQVDQFCSTPLVEKTITERFAGGGDIWYLGACPVKSITSIADGAGNTLAATDYILFEELGFIESYGRFPRATRATGQQDRWTVTYVAGHFATEGAVGGDAANAILDLVADYYHKSGPDVQSIRTGVENTVSFIPNPNSSFVLPPRVQNALSPYRRRSI